MPHTQTARSRRFGARTHGAAVLVRVAAFLIAAASIVIIPGALAATAGGQMTPAAAFAIVGIAVALIFIATFAARSLDPLRG